MNLDHLLISDLHILLVEPSETQSKIIKSHLLEENVQTVNVVKTVKEAEEIISNDAVDVVASAMYLSDGNGLDILKFIKDNNQLASIPFMLVSSETSMRKLEAFKQAGVAAILPKPFEPIHLSRGLNASLQLINTEEVDLDLFDVGEVRVLVVDDSKLARKHIVRVLEGMGLNSISEAENGAHALTLIKDNDFDLVVTDYNMPEMDGRELSEFIRFNPMTAHIPIIMVTSESASSATMANIQQTGVNALCDKPFEPNEVKAMLVSLLNSDESITK